MWNALGTRTISKMTAFFNRSSEKELRRDLRAQMPPAEILLWQQLKGRQLLDCKFRRQFSVGPYVLDFYSPEIKLAIEVDGDSHFQEGAKERDLERQKFIESFGISVVRFLNTEIHENMDGVLESLAVRVQERRRNTPSAPPF
jgi:very-short-patch-repair endonuclease